MDNVIFSLLISSIILLLFISFDTHELKNQNNKILVKLEQIEQKRCK